MIKQFITRLAFCFDMTEGEIEAKLEQIRKDRNCHHMKPLKLVQLARYWEVRNLPQWTDHMGTRPFTIWIEPRPPHCDRGRYIVKTDAPLDVQEGWPRYYFNLEHAFCEIEAWVNVRKECKAV